MNRAVRYGTHGSGRDLAHRDGKKVSQQAITASYWVDKQTMEQQMRVYDDNDQRSLMSRPNESDGAFRLLEGEIAFKVKGRGDSVLTALNGLDAPFVKIFPNNPQLVRALLDSIIIPIGIVEQDARTDIIDPKVTLHVGGTIPSGAPQKYNVPGQEKAFVTSGCQVVAGAPDLCNPIMFGNPEGGKPRGKVVLVLRAADKTSTAKRIRLVLGSFVHNPSKFRAAMSDYKKIALSVENAALSVINSYKVSALSVINLLLERGVLSVNNARSELRGAAPTEVTTRLAELLGVLERRRVYAELSAQERAFYTKLEFDLKQRMLPVPDPKSEAYNVRNEFGFSYDQQRNTWTSIARQDQTGLPRRTPAGQFLRHTLTHFDSMVETLMQAFYSEKEHVLGQALNTPSNTGSGIFHLHLMPHGGMTDMN